jgi:hypothetical protein
LGTAGVLLRRIRSIVRSEPTGFVWVERGRLAASGYPASRQQLAWAKKMGIGSVLTLTEEPLPSDWFVGLGMNAIHVPMEDHRPPSVQSLEAAVSRLEEELGAGRAVLVHCLAGVGRTMCVVSAYLIKSRRMTAAEALGFVRRIKPGSVERSQEDSLMKYEAWVRSCG